MGSFGWQELGVVAVVALLVFGPDRLPQMARQVAQFIGRVRTQANDAVNELKRAADVEGLGQEFKAVSAEVNEIRRTVTQTPRQALQEPRRDDDAPPIDPEAT